MTDQELFEKLKREGECWFTGYQIIQRCRGEDLDTGEISNCRIVYDPQERNPDFSTPDGFFWLWERAKEQDWWDEFCNASPHKAWLFPIGWINPTRFTEALKQYLEG